MTYELKDARLLTIGIDKSDPWAMIVGSSLDFQENYPKIKTDGLEPGYYSIRWVFTEDSVTHTPYLVFDLIKAGNTQPSEQVVLEAVPYISFSTVAFRASGIFGSNKPSIKVLSEMFPHKADGDPFSLINEFSRHQYIAFRQRMNDWIDFSGEEAENILANLHLMISSSFQMRSMVSTTDLSMVRLPPGYNIKSNE